MLKIILLTGFLAFSGTLATAQDNTMDSTIFRKWVTRTEIGYNFFTGKDAAVLQNTVRDLGSIKFNFAIQRRMYAGPVYFAPGIGLAISEWRFEKNLLLTPTDNDGLLVREDKTPERTYGKSKLQLVSFRVPVEVGFQARKFNIALGVYADVLLWAKHKRKYEQTLYSPSSNSSTNLGPGYKEAVVANVTSRDELRLRDIYYGVYARIAYRRVAIYVQYNLNTTFRAFPEVNAVQAGIAFSQPIYKLRKKFNWMEKLKPRTKST